MNKMIAAVAVAISVTALHPAFSIAEPVQAPSHGELKEMRNMQERRLVEELRSEGGSYYKELGAISTSILALDSMIAREERELYRLKDRDFFAPSQQ